MPSDQPLPLATLALLFLRIGCTSVGGFMAMVAVTQRVIVERHRLLPESDLLDGLALASILPGPVAINVVAYTGYRLRGVSGAAVAILCAVLPAFVCIVLLGSLYFRFGSMDVLRPLFLGITPAIVAVVLAAGCRLWSAAVHDWRQAALGIGAALALTALPGLPTTLALMAVAAVVGCTDRRPALLAAAAAAAATAANAATAAPAASAALRHELPLAVAAGLLPLSGMVAFSAKAGLLLQLAAVFAGMSLLTFGGGYVFIPLLQHTVVDTYGWLAPRQFVDALALTQLSPGPVMISSAFVGLKVAGLAGAIAASAGMFLPSAVLMIAASGAMQRIRGSARVQAALRGVRATLAGMVFSAAFTLAGLVQPGWAAVLICALALWALARWHIDAAWVVLCAALAGWLVF
ncbi:chromate transporter [Janthinobacterium sp. HH01]|uniref:chromate efflux transporter n=1 Tax=Janthinobacterium sp. HH01 TaxID=1198452 RepID=UPI0002AEAF4F|nr:chromate efflux transporter [Janthinobacterium sp. HH01]ELX09452.1 chromate transporter [Janthinobacterium sp. HH01]